VALAFRTPPDERTCWTMPLLADRLVDLTDSDKVSADPVRRALKNAPQPWRRAEWCIPAVSPGFVWRMEDVPERYAEP
jgi:hypothetical protein